MSAEAMVEEAVEIKRSKRLRGTPALPGDSLLGHHALLWAAMAEGASRLENLPTSPWFKEALEDFMRLGYAQQALDGHWLVHGGHPPVDGPEPLRLRHEGELLPLAGFLAAHGCRRPLEPDLAGIPGDALETLAAILPESGLHPKALGICRPEAAGWDEYLAKLVVLPYHLAAGKGLELHLGKGGPDVLESLALHFEAPLRVDRNEPPQGDELARRIARQLRAAGKQEPQTRLVLAEGARLTAQTYAVPADMTLVSAYCLAATLLKGSDLTLENVLLNPSRAGFLTALRRMGGDVEVVARRERGGEAYGTLRVRSADLMGKRFGAENLAGMRDEVFLLMAAAAFAEGETIIRDIAHLRRHNRDLLKGFAADLKGAGVEIGEIEDGLVIRGRADYDGHAYDAHGHAPLALAALVMGLKSHGTSSLKGAEGLEGRYPGLAEQLAALAAGDKP